MAVPSDALGPGWSVAVRGHRYCLYLPARRGRRIEWLPGHWSFPRQRDGYWTGWQAPAMVEGWGLWSDTLGEALDTFLRTPHGKAAAHCLGAAADDWLALPHVSALVGV